MKHKKIAVLLLCALFAPSCSDDTTPTIDIGIKNDSEVADVGYSQEPGQTIDAQPGEKGVKLTAIVQNLTQNKKYTPSKESFWFGPEVSVNVSPSAYKLALVNFWLVKDDNTEINLINPDPTNPIYTETNPLIMDFTTPNQAQSLFDANSLPAGTYVGYKMQFLYIEMEIPIVFHIPSMSVETDYANAASIKDTQIVRRFRLYFNAIDKYWKRDFVTQLDDGTDLWFWLRRALEDQDGVRNFFISTANNSHPPGGAAPNSTIDLFADDTFWGPESDYSTNTNPIIIGTHSTAGGLNVGIDQPFTIPQVIDSLFELKLFIDVSNTLNFWEDTSSAPAGVTFTDNVLDLGPGYNNAGTPEQYGDKGLHPMMPRFSLTTPGSNPNDGGPKPPPPNDGGPKPPPPNDGGPKPPPPTDGNPPPPPPTDGNPPPPPPNDGNPPPPPPTDGGSPPPP